MHEKIVKSKNQAAMIDQKVKQINDILQKNKGKYSVYITDIAKWLLFCYELYQDYDETYYKRHSLEELQATNRKMYHAVMPENYEHSFANPSYCIEQFGQEWGQLFSSYYFTLRQVLYYVRIGYLFKMDQWFENFINVYDLISKEEISYEECKKLMTNLNSEISLEEQKLSLLRNFDSVDTTEMKILSMGNYDDPRYLYQYLKYISDNEIAVSDFMKDYPEEQAKKLGKAVAKAYIRGFELARKDYKKRKNAKVVYHAGEEKIVKEFIREMKNYGLSVSCNSAISKSVNRQYAYDHRFDNALYLDETYVKSIISLFSEAIESIKEVCDQYSGTIYFDQFGEKPFQPKNKKGLLTLTQEQQILTKQMRAETGKIHSELIPRKETSFCIIAFPSPEIGDQFAEIYKETLDINMIDTEHWEEIQQKIVDVLDTATYVHVKGKDTNQTDIKVSMHKLDDPDKQTNFVNCGADVNIPVGEVFTSPVLKGTNGILHISEVFLNELKFIDLKITFKDGFITEYSCKNFESDEENQKFISENLLFPHTTLPIGEFAIGTNTKAYTMARKYDILHLLPILIVEKMGPHFAIGDTCFSWEEDFAVYNPIDNKEIIARDNEMSIKRKTNLQEAYTNKHIDITLPYDELAVISAVDEDNHSIDIIRDGKFVVPGTEELNSYL